MGFVLTHDSRLMTNDYFVWLCVLCVFFFRCVLCGKIDFLGFVWGVFTLDKYICGFIFIGNDKKNI